MHILNIFKFIIITIVYHISTYRAARILCTFTRDMRQHTTTGFILIVTIITIIIIHNNSSKSEANKRAAAPLWYAKAYKEQDSTKRYCVVVYSVKRRARINQLNGRTEDALRDAVVVAFIVDSVVVKVIYNFKCETNCWKMLM